MHGASSMETSLHRQLKDHYADANSQLEARVGAYRIDVKSANLLIEIQHGSLAAIRDKIKRLLASNRVLVVKPLIARKLLIRKDAKHGRVIGRRLSPKRSTLLNLFDELVYFTRVFPHPNLTLEVCLVEIEEHRYPGHGRRRRRRANDFQIEDQVLTRVSETHCFSTLADLAGLIPQNLPMPFHTGDVAEALAVDRWVAQRIVYCLRETGAVSAVGKQGNTRLYVFADSAQREVSRVGA